MTDDIRIGVSGFAEYVTSSPATRTKRLRPFKFRSKGEGAGRSGYYKMAKQAIREYHEAGNDQAVFRRVRQELAATMNTTSDRLVRTKCASNIAAIDAYERIYGRRYFTVLRNHRLSYSLGPVTITAQPDLWVEENGTEVLIKIGVAKKKAILTDVMLYLIRKAAVSSGYRIRARNVVYLDITEGVERSCDDKLSQFNRTDRKSVV